MRSDQSNPTGKYGAYVDDQLLVFTPLNQGIQHHGTSLAHDHLLLHIDFRDQQPILLKVRKVIRAENAEAAEHLKGEACTFSTVRLGFYLPSGVGHESRTQFELLLFKSMSLKIISCFFKT